MSDSEDADSSALESFEDSLEDNSWICDDRGDGVWGRFRTFGLDCGFISVMFSDGFGDAGRGLSEVS